MTRPDSMWVPPTSIAEHPMRGGSSGRANQSCTARLGRSISIKKLLVVGGTAVGVVGVGFLAKSLASRSGRVHVLLRNKRSPRPRGHGFQRNALTETL